jgi:hypothetical protein
MYGSYSDSPQVRIWEAAQFQIQQYGLMLCEFAKHHTLDVNFRMLGKFGRRAGLPRMTGPRLTLAMSSHPSTPGSPPARLDRRKKRDQTRSSSFGNSILWLGLLPILLLIPWWAVRAHYSAYKALYACFR